MIAAMPSKTSVAANQRWLREIMSPHYLRDPPQPAVVPRERWYEAPAAGE